MELNENNILPDESHLNHETQQDFSTNNFVVKFVRKNGDEYEANIYFKGTPVNIFNSETIILCVPEAFYVPIDELSQIPALVQIHHEKINENEVAEGPHVKTIIDYTPDGAELEIIVFESLDDFFDQYENPEKYLQSMKNVIESDPRLSISSESEEGDRLDIDTQIELQNMEMPVTYSPIGPIPFRVALKAQTFGELALAADQLMYELEEKSKLYY